MSSERPHRLDDLPRAQSLGRWLPAANTRSPSNEGRAYREARTHAKGARSTPDCPNARVPNSLYCEGKGYSENLCRIEAWPPGEKTTLSSSEGLPAILG